MNKRERTLLTIVIAIIGLGVVYYGLTQVTGKFRQRRAQINQLTGDIELEGINVLAAQRAQQELDALSEKALSYDKEEAQRVYMEWLTDWADRNELQERKLKVESTRSRTIDKRELYRTHAFALAGKTDLGKLTKMLYEFETAKQLHRIRALNITPVAEKELEIYLTIDAVSLPMAEARESIEVDQELITEMGDLVSIQEPIFKRNLFGPENNAPRLGVRSSYTVELGRSLEMDLDGSDKDNIDKLTYDADLKALEGARLRGDKVEWRPRELGDYYAEVEVRDDGFPSLTHRRQVKVSVVEPRPTPPPTRPKPPPVFDFAAYTQLNAIIVKSGEPTAWLWVRPTDERLKIKVGETFKIGEMEGRMTAIAYDNATFESDGKRYQVDVRGFVGKAKYLGDVEVKTSTQEPSSPPKEEVLLPPLEEAPVEGEAPAKPTTPDEKTVAAEADKATNEDVAVTKPAEAAAPGAAEEVATDETEKPAEPTKTTEPTETNVKAPAESSPPNADSAE